MTYTFLQQLPSLSVKILHPMSLQVALTIAKEVLIECDLLQNGVLILYSIPTSST